MLAVAVAAVVAAVPLKHIKRAPVAVAAVPVVTVGILELGALHPISWGLAAAAVVAPAQVQRPVAAAHAAGQTP